MRGNSPPCIAHDEGSRGKSRRARAARHATSVDSQASLLISARGLKVRTTPNARETERRRVAKTIGKTASCQAENSPLTAGEIDAASGADS